MSKYSDWADIDSISLERLLVETTDDGRDALKKVLWGDKRCNVERCRESPYKLAEEFRKTAKRAYGPRHPKVVLPRYAEILQRILEADATGADKSRLQDCQTFGAMERLIISTITGQEMTITEELSTARAHNELGLSLYAHRREMEKLCSMKETVRTISSAVLSVLLFSESAADRLVNVMKEDNVEAVVLAGVFVVAEIRLRFLGDRARKVAERLRLVAGSVPEAATKEGLT